MTPASLYSVCGLLALGGCRSDAVAGGGVALSDCQGPRGEGPDRRSQCLWTVKLLKPVKIQFHGKSICPLSVFFFCLSHKDSK